MDSIHTFVCFLYLLKNHLKQPAGCPLLPQDTEKASVTTLEDAMDTHMFVSQGCPYLTHPSHPAAPVPQTQVCFSTPATLIHSPPIPLCPHSHISLQDTQLLLLLSISQGKLSWEWRPLLCRYWSHHRLLTSLFSSRGCFLPAPWLGAGLAPWEAIRPLLLPAPPNTPRQCFSLLLTRLIAAGITPSPYSPSSPSHFPSQAETKSKRRNKNTQSTISSPQSPLTRFSCPLRAFTA